MSKMRKINSTKVKNMVKKYLRKERNALTFKEVSTYQRSADGWTVDGLYNNLSLGWRYFIVYIEDGKVSSCLVY